MNLLALFKTAPTTLKAILAGIASLVGAATASANGFDFEALDLGQWLVSLGTGLVTTGALFHDPNSEGKPSFKSKPVSAVEDVIKHATKAQTRLTADALDAIDQISDSLHGLFDQLPIDLTPKLPDLGKREEPEPEPEPEPTKPTDLGSLASQVIDKFKKAVTP